MSETLPPHLMQLGSDPDLLRRELIGEITSSIQDHPRSQQVELGPSEIGDECARRLGYKLLGQPENAGKPNWKATVGTALHTYLEGVIDKTNLRLSGGLEGQERYLIETDLHIGTLGGRPLRGHCDLYDRVTATVVDWKTVGPTQLKKYRSKGPGEKYRIQAHSYGLGWVNRGLPVERVAVMFLPRNGELHEHYWWSEPFDASVAIAGIQRAEGIAITTQALGHAALPLLPTADSFCTLCPYYKAGSTNLSTGCPGDENTRSTVSAPALTLL